MDNNQDNNDHELPYRVAGFVAGGDFHLATGRTRGSEIIMAESPYWAERKAYEGKFEEVLSIEEVADSDENLLNVGTGKR